MTQSGTYIQDQNYLTDVGAFTNSVSYYGTFDQSGLVFQWNDLDGTAGSLRGRRAGSWQTEAQFLSSSYNELIDASIEDYGSKVGFRLAAPAIVPEPSTDCMALAGLACGGFSMWRRRRRA